MHGICVGWFGCRFMCAKHLFEGPKKALGVGSLISLDSDHNSPGCYFTSFHRSADLCSHPASASVGVLRHLLLCSDLTWPLESPIRSSCYLGKSFTASYLPSSYQLLKLGPYLFFWSIVLLKFSFPCVCIFQNLTLCVLLQNPTKPLALHLM